MTDERFPVFVAALISSLDRRYKDCPATVTPDSILLAVLNAVEEARQHAFEELP